MIRLTADHAFAIARAEASVHPLIIPNMSPHQRKCIEDDLVRLSEVKWFILKHVYEPGLPHGDKDNSA